MTVFSQFETNILLWIQQNLRTPALDGLAKVLDVIGNGGIIWIALTIVLLLIKKTRRIGVYCAISMILTLIVVNGFIKPFVNRPRPYMLTDELIVFGKRYTDGSFPSGHAANGLACSWVLFRKDRKRLGIPTLILAGVIAIFRLYSALHFPVDVLVGVVIGIAMAEISVRAFRKPVRKLFKRFPKLR